MAHAANTQRKGMRAPTAPGGDEHESGAEAGVALAARRGAAEKR
jgi:hypothetical protein